MGGVPHPSPLCLPHPPLCARGILLAPGLAPRFDPGTVQTTAQH